MLILEMAQGYGLIIWMIARDYSTRSSTFVFSSIRLNQFLLHANTLLSYVLNRDYLEDPAIKKIYHHYSFDHHVLVQSGITPRGFGGDTMQMARLWDSSRMMEGGGYSLAGIPSNDISL